MLGKLLIDEDVFLPKDTKDTMFKGKWDMKHFHINLNELKSVRYLRKEGLPNLIARCLKRL